MHANIKSLPHKKHTQDDNGTIQVTGPDKNLGMKIFLILS